jgi:hypothetical protein
MEAFFIDMGQEDCAIGFGGIGLPFTTVSESFATNAGVVLGSGGIDKGTDGVEFVLAVIFTLVLGR